MDVDVDVDVDVDEDEGGKPTYTMTATTTGTTTATGTSAGAGAANTSDNTNTTTTNTSTRGEYNRTSTRKARRGGGGGGGGGGDKDKGKVAQTVASFASGCASGVLSAVILQPMDVLKTKMQGDVLKTGEAKSVWSVTRNTIRQGGIKGLWTGTKPAVVRVGLGIGVYMATIEVLRKKFGETQEDGSVKITPVYALATGAFARSIATVLVSPITVVKTRVEYFGAMPRKNFIQCLNKLVKKEGIGGLYRGVVPNIISSVPFSGIYYSLYTTMQGKMIEHVDQPPIVRNLVSSSFAALIATVLTQPADILRTQAQLEFTNANAYRMLYNRCRQLGFQTLFIGSAPRFAKRTLQAVLVWTVYEELFRIVREKKSVLMTS